MNVDEAYRQLADGDADPRDAMQWSRDHWEEASRRYIPKLRMLARHGSDPDTDVHAVERMFLLCAEKRDARAFAPLCDLIASNDSLAGWLGQDPVSAMLIDLCDGDIEPLTRAIESDRGDEFTRGSALTALAYLVRARKLLTDQEMRDYLAHLRKTMQPRGESYVWAAWAWAVAQLGYEPLRAEVGRLFAEKWVSRQELELEDFYEDLQLARRDPDGLAAFHERGILPYGMEIPSLGSTGLKFEPTAANFEDNHTKVETPYVNPTRDVGRNDPCPCGSGKKYKKCCAAA